MAILRRRDRRTLGHYPKSCSATRRSPRSCVGAFGRIDKTGVVLILYVNMRVILAFFRDVHLHTKGKQYMDQPKSVKTLLADTGASVSGERHIVTRFPMDQHVSTVEQGLDHFSERSSTAKKTSSVRRLLARLVGVALGVLAVACGSIAAPISNDAKLHLAAAPEDFKALGIGEESAVRA